MKTSKTRAAMIGAALIAAFGAGLIAEQASADQPRMMAALEQLRGARASLIAAEADKGGHRAHAIQLVDAAIGEVKAGIGYANRP